MPPTETPFHHDFFLKAQVLTKHWIPLFHSFVQAGFPSPSENYIERVCDLNDLCVTNAEATYFVRVAGESMMGDRIEPGDVLVVDSSREDADGKIAIVWINGEYTVKRVNYEGDTVVLTPSNPHFTPLRVNSGDDFRIFGLVTFVIHKP
ncbi:LexA family protein [Persicitalea jodogahamensis]|uniref:Protein impA n=1 Tax=Persicitalea jodogahamensis TaxID=402147 RepID=A0A8J3D5W7_9BACT|nr:translesion error-prone DNA polymerase V autoproteolytic subunit [Persicitalea jodogahamensis]GHB87522.1 protein impA' [Persicitalea jodogahamensis]